MKTLRYTIVAVVALVSLSSCHIYNKYDAGRQDDARLQEYAAAAAAEVDSTALGNLAWEAVFTDPQLQDLIGRALANNVNLENARLNVEVARANMLGAKLSYLPSVALAPQGTLAKNITMGGDFGKTYSIPLSISWEIDVFGKLLNGKRGAQATLSMQEDYRQAVQSQIICGVASCYYTLSNLEAQLELSRETAELWRQSVQTMKDFKETGRVTEAAVVQSQAQYASIQASITDLETALVRANNTMSLLVNEAPQRYAVPAGAQLAMPTFAQEGVALSQLARRPDVRQAEANLAVAYYATNSARAAFYPSLTIGANVAFTNSLGSYIVNPGQWLLNLVGNLTAPLFSRGQNIARLKGAKAQQEQALNSFKYKLLDATAEVMENLTTLQKTGEKSGYLNEQVGYLQQAVEMTNLLLAYDGQTTYLEVLNAQSSLLQAQMGALDTSLAHSQAIINLYQSLGGAR